MAWTTIHSKLVILFWTEVSNLLFFKALIRIFTEIVSWLRYAQSQAVVQNGFCWEWLSWLQSLRLAFWMFLCVLEGRGGGEGDKGKKEIEIKEQKSERQKKSENKVYMEYSFSSRIMPLCFCLTKLTWLTCACSPLSFGLLLALLSFQVPLSTW